MNFKVPRAEKLKKVLIHDHSKKNFGSLKYYLSEVSDYTSIMNCDNLDESVDGINHHINK